MNESDNKTEKKISEQIYEYIKKKGSVSLEELRKKWYRQAILYNIPKLCKDNRIKSYIKGSGLKDNEIFYTILQPYEQPQDIKELIERLTSTDKTVSSQAFEEFVKLCWARHLGERFYVKDTEGNYVFKDGKRLEAFIYQDESEEIHEKVILAKAKKLAYALMSGMYPELKEKVAFKLTYVADSIEDMKKVKDITFSL